MPKADDHKTGKHDAKDPENALILESFRHGLKNCTIFEPDVPNDRVMSSGFATGARVGTEVLG